MGRRHKAQGQVRGAETLLKMNFLYTAAAVAGSQEGGNEGVKGLVRHLAAAVKATGRKTVQRM